jgi:protein CpxP
MTGSRIAAIGRGARGLAIIAALTLASGVAVAQQEMGRRGPDADAQLAQLTTRLHLSADQQQQIRPILVERNQQMVALRTKVRSGELDRAAAGSQMQAIHQETTQKIEAVLTPDQRSEYEKYLAEIAERWNAHPGMHRGGGGMGAGSGMGPGPGGGGGNPAP